MGSRREQGYIPSSAPPTSLGGTSLVGETVLGSPHCPLQGQQLANGSRHTNSTWPVQGGFLH